MKLIEIQMNLKNLSMWGKDRDMGEQIKYQVQSVYLNRAVHQIDIER